MKQIVNVNKNLGIGIGGDLLCHIPEDMKFFKEQTFGKTVVMGRKTLESLPQGRPLKGRKNIVLTSHKPCAKDTQFISEDASDKTELIYVSSVEELLSVLPKDKSEVYVIGGASIYRELLPYCDELLITENDCKKVADCFYPDPLLNGFKLKKRSEEKEHNGIHYSFACYTRKKDCDYYIRKKNEYNGKIHL